MSTKRVWLIYAVPVEVEASDLAEAYDLALQEEVEFDRAECIDYIALDDTDKVVSIGVVNDVLTWEGYQQ